ncbi:MAG TPA: esterase-like activity of phytase family protein [Bauldia sp.]|nr:esterase-like activity of phytase family protein [Bauldia sp.]
MRQTLLAATAIAALLSASARAEEQEYPATLVGHAILPAATFIKPPADAPSSLATAGKYTTPDRHRADILGSVPGMDGVRPTGLSVPFDGQAVQGFSGIKLAEDGTFWSLSDNGFGNKLNSVDAALMLHHLKIDWEQGKVERVETIFLSDPEKKVWFPIVNEGTKERYLTGADFDIEGIQPVADGFWIGDEFGPFFVKVDKAGKVVAVVDTIVDGKPVKSPDHPTMTLQANPTLPVPAFNLTRSGGYEGLAQSKDGTKIYGLLEGALFLEDGTMEMVDGNRVFRIVELDAATATLTGRTWLYRLSDGGDAIGDFNMIDETTALVIERDQGAGTPDKACPDPKAPTPDCFATPAKFKRIYKIEFGDGNVGQPVTKIGYIDLLNIKDPDNVKRQGGGEGFYDMPFNTIENVDIVDATHIIVADDNNLPFSAGRTLDKADDNEFVLLEVGDFLKAEAASQ